MVGRQSARVMGGWGGEGGRGYGLGGPLLPTKTEMGAFSSDVQPTADTWAWKSDEERDAPMVVARNGAFAWISG